MHHGKRQWTSCGSLFTTKESKLNWTGEEGRFLPKKHPSLPTLLSPLSHHSFNTGIAWSSVLCLLTPHTASGVLIHIHGITPPNYSCPVQLPLSKSPGYLWLDFIDPSILNRTKIELILPQNEFLLQGTSVYPESPSTPFSPTIQ